jgi:Flp pilus assembly protein TadB
MDVLFTDPLGIKATGVAMFMMGLGVICMRQIVQIRV